MGLTCTTTRRHTVCYGRLSDPESGEGGIGRHGTWWFRLDVGTDPVTNKRRQIAKGGFATKQEAQSALAEAMNDVAQGSFRHDEGLTVDAYLRRWLHEKDQVLRATTLRDYQRHVDRHLIPALGDL